MAEKAPYSNLVERYERLKRQYFSNNARTKYDEDGEEIPNAVDRAFLVQQFENLGVELPLSPDYPLTPKNRPNNS